MYGLDAVVQVVALPSGRLREPYLYSARNGRYTILCCSGWSSTAGRYAAASDGRFLARKTFLAPSRSPQLCLGAGRTRWGHSTWIPLSEPATTEKGVTCGTLHATIPIRHVRQPLNLL